MTVFRQITKYKMRYAPKKEAEQEVDAKEIPSTTPTKKNNTKKNRENMNEKVSKAAEIMDNMMAAENVKVLKKDRGLIERTESSKIILTEDNRQVLND